jgi:hypothetical protein
VWLNCIAELVEQLVTSGATDVGHAAKRRFPHNPIIAKCVGLMLNEVVAGEDKQCVIC